MVTASLLALLEQVEDPELPTINIVELGLVRDVSITDGVVTVNITPTYSGCPVMEVLRDEIIKTLNANGFSDVRVETILAPPWTTDWTRVDLPVWRAPLTRTTGGSGSASRSAVLSVRWYMAPF